MSDGMTLGELIAVLELLPSKFPVEHDRCRGGVEPQPESYRGHYDHLSICPGGVATVGELLRGLRDAVHAEFHGYKGGTYTMTDDTPVWLSAWGEASGDRIVGVHMTDRIVRLTTFKECDQW